MFLSRRRHQPSDRRPDPLTGEALDDYYDPAITRWQVDHAAVFGDMDRQQLSRFRTLERASGDPETAKRLEFQRWRGEHGR